ncbi:MAG: gluconate 2-dehydrogenase subunit 3 family protein [Cyclobacterium sp.]|uniref:gluconate 2-dehydrogenase subunit 3 family protein n=1 Tax=unclassified Cyclobacterium TaxID=2615055 RepID=UPI0013D2450D|nr:gluconate 2-dehydrogenase subunit 3 family protein [Cyclobacterium sp. SYSU L10401]
MDRRSAMKQLAILTGGIITIPACDFSEEAILQAYQNLNITASQKALLTRITNTIFPGTTLKKAEDLQLQDFVLVMCNDCLQENQQQSFVNGLKQWDEFSQQNFGKAFSKMDQATAADAIRQTMAMEAEPGSKTTEMGRFLAITKQFALQGYLNSEYFMTEIKPYELVPARFFGSKKIENA